MHKLISIYVLFLISISGYSQISLEPSIVASGGGYSESETMNISFTIGELATPTLTGEGMILTQGFQQPLGIGTGIIEKEIDWEISAYPNPVNNLLYVKFNIDRTRNFWIELQDVTGRVISLEAHKEIIPGDIVEFNTSNFTTGIYLIKVYSSGGQSQVLNIRKL